MERVCFVLQVYFTCVPTRCTNAEEWLELAKTKQKQTLSKHEYIQAFGYLIPVKNPTKVV